VQRMIDAFRPMLVLSLPCVALFGLVFPIQALAISQQLDRQGAGSDFVREFSTGASLRLGRTSGMAGESNSPQGLLSWLDLSRPRPQPAGHLVFEDSAGEQLHLYFDVDEESKLRASFDGVFEVEFDFGRDVSPGQGVIPASLSFAGHRIDLSNPSTLTAESKQILEGLGQRLEERLSPRLREELVSAARQLTEDRAAHEPDGTSRITSELRPLGWLDCGLAIISYVGSIVGLALCLTIVACVFAIVFHYASIYGVVSACVGWIRDRAQERADCLDEDPETPCSE